MTRANKVLAVIVVSALGLWGCAQGPANGVGSAERIRALEGKAAKLEEDYRAAAAARDQLRKRLNEAEEARTKLAKDAERHQLLVKEHEEVKTQLTSRTTERDALQGQFEAFRKNIRSLLGQADAAAANPTTTSAVSLLGAPQTPKL